MVPETPLVCFPKAAKRSFPLDAKVACLVYGFRVNVACNFGCRSCVPHLQISVNGACNFCMILGVRFCMDLCMGYQEFFFAVAVFGCLRFFALSLPSSPSPPPSLLGAGPGSCSFSSFLLAQMTPDFRYLRRPEQHVQMVFLPVSSLCPGRPPPPSLLPPSAFSLSLLSLSLLHASVWLGNLWQVQRDED